MRGSPIAEIGHVVHLVPAIDITGGVTGDVFSMKHYSHATILVGVGVSAAAFTKIIVNSVDDAAGNNPAAMPFALYPQETSAGDTLGALEAVAAAGKTPSANDDIFYVIEINAEELPDGQDWVQLSLTNGVNAVQASAWAILTGARYGGADSPTAIA